MPTQGVPAPGTAIIGRRDGSPDEWDCERNTEGSTQRADGIVLRSSFRRHLLETTLGLAHRTPVSVGRLLVVGGPLHFPQHAFTLTQLLEPPHELLYRFVWTGSDFDHYCVKRSLLDFSWRTTLPAPERGPALRQARVSTIAAEHCSLFSYRRERNSGFRSTARRLATARSVGAP